MTVSDSYIVRLKNLLPDLIILAICIAISELKPVPFPFKVPLIATVIVSYIYFRYRTLSLIGIKKIAVNKLVTYAALAFLIIVVGISNLLNPLISMLLDENIDTSAYGDLAGNLNFVMNYWWKAMISAAIAEEIFYRGFGFYLLEKVFKNIPYEKVTIVLVSSLYFALSHSFQGTVGVIGIFMASVVFGWLYFYSNKNIWVVILAHALVDSWSLFSLYHGGIRLFF